MFSQRPSDANIKNLSWGRIALEYTDGSAVNTGRRRGSGSQKRVIEGSTANSGLFRYASPIDLDTYRNQISRNKISTEKNSIKEIKVSYKQSKSDIVLMKDKNIHKMKC